MKKITAIIRADKLKDVEEALRLVNAPGFTFFNVRGHGRETETYLVSVPELPETASVAIPPAFIVADVLTKVKVEVICKDDDVQRIVGAVRESSKSGKSGDGIVFVSPIDQIIRILSGEEGEQAL